MFPASILRLSLFRETSMRLSETDKLLMERGWHYCAPNLWHIDIGGVMFAYNTEQGILTKQEGYDTNLVQTQATFSDVLALGFSDDWNHPKNRLERDKMKLEHVYHIEGDLGLLP